MKEVYRNATPSPSAVIASGVHRAATSSTILSAKDVCFSAVDSVGRRILNITDGSSGIVRSTTFMDNNHPFYSTLTATLSGGTNNNWEVNDTYNLLVGATLNTKISSTEVGRMSGLAYPRKDMIDGELPGWGDIDQQTMTVHRKRY